MTDNSAGRFAMPDRLYRWRWWLSGILVGASIALGTTDAATGPITWVLFALMLFLVWVPALVRWTQAARAARTAFREGFSNDQSR